MSLLIKNFFLFYFGIEFEDTIGVIRSCKSKHRQCNDQQERQTKWQTTIYQTLHRKLKIGQDKNLLNLGVNSAEGSEMLAPAAPLMTPVVLLLNDTDIIWHGNRVGHQYT